jgi:basic membrane protein A
MSLIRINQITVLLTLLVFFSYPVLAEPQQPLRVGVLFPGVVVDKDFNELGYMAMIRAQDELGVTTCYRQRIPPWDSSRAIRELIGDGCSVIWGHGGQYLEAILGLCAEYPGVAFIAEAEEPVPNQCGNVHILGREYHKGFYVLGALAAKITKTGIIGYIGGMPQPFSRAQVNAALMAIKQYNPKATLKYVNVGDFNDPMHSRQAAEVFIMEGCDVILSGVNMGNFGIIEAINNFESPVFFTTVYTSKLNFSKNRFLTSDMFDFTSPILDIIRQIQKGITSGYIPMPWGEGKARYTLFPISNVPSSVNEDIKIIANKITTGEIIVPNDMISIPSNLQ